MRILRILSSMNPEDGGVTEAVKQSILLMSEYKDIKIEVACFDNSDSPWLKEYNFKIYALGKGYSSYQFNLNYLKWLSTNARNYDLVIIDGLWTFHIWGSYLLKIMKVPYLIYTHGMLDPYFNEDKLKYIKKLPFWFAVNRNALSFAKKVVFTCKEEMELAKNSFPFYKVNPSIVTIGIESNEKSKEFLNKTFYNEFPELKEKNIGLYLSRIHKKKGIDLLVDAVNNIKELIPDNFIFVIAGSGDSEYREKLEKKIDNLSLNKYFRWVGMLKGDIKWGAFSSADFFILPSHQENFGIVIAEALSMNTPILTTNKVNIWKEISDYNAGFIDDDSIEGITNILSKYFKLANNEKEKLRDNSISCFKESFSIEKFKKDFRNLIIDNIKGN